MIICFSCSAETKRTLDELMASEEYRDYGELLAAAVSNLQAIHSELGSGGVLVIADNAQRVDQPISARRHRRKRGSARTESAPQPPPVRGSAPDEPRRGKMIPEFFMLRGKTADSGSPARLPSDVWALGEVVPLDRWTFGQYNRLLPVKATCRGLVSLLLDSPKGVSIRKAPTLLAKAATELGDYLAYVDELQGHSRDMALATAFPTSGESVAKSQARYANQFVAAVNKKGQLSGLPVDLKLLNWANGGTERLQLTQAGWNFALLESPVLDRKKESKSTIPRLGEDEARFLLRHIAEHVPAEDFAYRSILRAVLDGANTPDALDAALRSYAPRREERELSDSFLASQRSGAVSRMSDLGLLERQRSGLRVAYVATQVGELYLNDDERLDLEES